MNYYDNPYRRLMSLGMAGWKRMYDEGGAVATEGEGDSVSDADELYTPTTPVSYDRWVNAMADILRMNPGMEGRLYDAAMKVAQERGVLADGDPVEMAYHSPGMDNGVTVIANAPDHRVGERAVYDYVNRYYTDEYRNPDDTDLPAIDTAIGSSLERYAQQMGGPSIAHPGVAYRPRGKYVRYDMRKWH